MLRKDLHHSRKYVHMVPIERNKQLRQSNLITNSRYSMSAVEMNIIFLLIAQLKKDDPVDQVYHISVKELEETSGSTINYGRLKEYTFKLRNRGYEIEHKDGYLQVGICASVEYIRHKGLLEIEVARKLRPFLFDLKDNFTTYSLRTALKIRSTYAKRLYQMFCMWRSTGRFFIKIEDLKYKLDLIDPVSKEEKYPKYGMFKKKVLEVALSEINANTNLAVEMEERKTGRKITNLIFHIKERGEVQELDDQKYSEAGHESGLAKSVDAETDANCHVQGIVYHPDEPRDGRRPVCIRLINDFGLTQAQAGRIIGKYPYKEITKRLYEAQLAMADRRVSNPTAYVLSVLK